MKCLKKKLGVGLALLVCFSSSSVFASENNFSSINDTFIEERNSTIKPRFANDFFYRKKDVKTSSRWSEYRRVSANLKTGSEGGSISSNKAETFQASVSGNIHGLNINLGKSVASSKGYTLNVGGNKRVYMAYRVKYGVESGVRETYDVVTGKVISRNKYTVEKPLHGEYTLLSY